VRWAGASAPKWPIGKDTTYVTGPLDQEGYIDYEAAINEHAGKGMTPQTNANVPFWNAIGPTYGGKDVPSEFFQRLDMPVPPKGQEYYRDLDAYMKTQKLAGLQYLKVLDQYTASAQRTWTAQDYPHIAAFLSSNDKPLSAIVEATKRSVYFNPLVRPRDEKAPHTLIDALPFSSLGACRETAHWLRSRAMLRVGERKCDEAWGDLLACHRLGRLLSQGATAIEYLTGIAIDAGDDADLAFLQSTNLSPKQIQDCLTDLKNLPAIPPLADRFEFAERLVYLDAL
jgi:hypothetical protein